MYNTAILYRAVGYIYSKVSETAVQLESDQFVCPVYTDTAASNFPLPRAAVGIRLVVFLRPNSTRMDPNAMVRNRLSQCSVTRLHCADSSCESSNPSTSVGPVANKTILRSSLTLTLSKGPNITDSLEAIRALTHHASPTTRRGAQQA